MSTSTTPGRLLDLHTVYLGKDRRCPVVFAGAWIIDANDYEDEVPGDDWDSRHAVALTASGDVAVYRWHEYDEYPPSLTVYYSIEEADLPQVLVERFQRDTGEFFFVRI